MEREQLLLEIKDLKKTADKKHSLSGNAMQKLDFLLASSQLKATLVHEHQFEDEDLCYCIEEFQRVKETKIKLK